MSKELFEQLDYWIDKHGGLGLDTPLPLLIQQLKAENERLAQTAEVIETQFHERLEDELKPLQQEIAQLQQQLEQAEMEKSVFRRQTMDVWIANGWYLQSLKQIQEYAATNALSSLRKVNIILEIALKPLPDEYAPTAMQLVEAVIESVGDEDYIEYQTGQIPRLANKLFEMRKAGQ